jgi:hypothetical protein
MDSLIGRFVVIIAINVCLAAVPALAQSGQLANVDKHAGTAKRLAAGSGNMLAAIQKRIRAIRVIRG